MKKLILLVVVIAALAAGWYLVSPWLAMNGLREAAQERDRAELAERVDFAAVRESVKQQIQDRVARRIGQPESRGAIERIGGRIASRVAGGAVELAATPEGMAAIITSGALVSPLLPRTQAVEWEVERDGISQFRGVGTREDGSAAPTLVFRRDGLSWTLVAVELP